MNKFHWWRSLLLGSVGAAMLACGGSSDSDDSPDGGSNAPRPVVSITMNPDPAVVQQGSSIVVRLDVTGADNSGLTGYEIDLDEVLSKIDIRTSPCPPQLARPACQDWTISPAANAVPGVYTMHVRTVGLGDGRVGNGSLQLQVAAAPMQQLGAAVAVAPDSEGGLMVLNSDGRVYSSGSNGDAQLGDGYLGLDLAGSLDSAHPEPSYTYDTFVEANVEPVDFVSIARSDRAAYAVSRDGRVWHWGSRQSGRGGEGPIREDARYRITPAPVPGLENIVSVATSTSINLPTYAIDADGRVWTWGGDSADDFPSVPWWLEGANIQAVVPGTSQKSNLYLHRSGVVTQWHYMGEDSTRLLPSPISLIASAPYVGLLGGAPALRDVEEVFLAVTADTGALWVWFRNRDGSFSEPRHAPPRLIHVTSVAIDSLGVVYAIRQGSPSMWVYHIGDTLESQIREFPPPSGGRFVKVAPGHGIVEDCSIVGGGSLVRIQRTIGETVTYLPIVYPQFGTAGGGGCATSRNDDGRISVATRGGGKVISIPAGIDCGQLSCEREFRAGSRIRLVPVPQPDWIFSRWLTTDGADPSICRDSLSGGFHHPGIPIQPNMRLHCTAEFVEAPPEEFRLSLRMDRLAGTVSSAPAGILCDPQCAHWFSRDAEVVLSAVPNHGFRFEGFRNARLDVLAVQDDCRDGTLTMTGPRFCEAVFAALPLPPAPSGFSATPTQTTVTLQWQATPTEVDGYRLERSQSGGPFALIAELSPSTASFVDEAVFVDTRYEYRLAAFIVHGAGAAATVSTSTSPNAPPNNGSRWEQFGTTVASGTVPALALDAQRQPVVAVLEPDANGVDRLRVRRFANGQWADVGTPGLVLNPSPAMRALEPAIAVDPLGRIVVAWGQADVDGQIRLSAVRSNGAGWDRLCGDPTTCAVNFSPSTPIQSPSLAIDPGGAPVLAWVELGSPAIKRFDGAGWQLYGEGRGPVAAGFTTRVKLAFGAASPLPHVAWIARAGQDFVGVAHFNGIGWVHLGSSLTGTEPANDRTIGDLGLGVAPTGAPVVGWVQGGAGGARTYARAWATSTSTWTGLDAGSLTTSAPLEGFAFALAVDGTPYVALSTSSPTSAGSLDVARWFDGRWQAVARRDGTHSQLSMGLSPDAGSISPHFSWLRGGAVEAWRWLP